MYNIVEAQCVLYVIKIKVSAVTRKVVNILLVLLSVSVAENCHYFITKAILRPGNEDFTNTTSHQNHYNYAVSQNGLVGCFPHNFV